MRNLGEPLVSIKREGISKAKKGNVVPFKGFKGKIAFLYIMNQSGGYLELILGPMFSGKTTRLIQHYKAYKFIGKKIVVINYSLDTRYSETALSSHDRVEIPCVFTNALADKTLWIDADVILINEGQFFDDLVPTVIEMVDTYQKQVHICGLDGDFRRERFGSLLDLIPYSDKVEKLSAFCGKCRDGTLAVFSHRVSTESAQVVIGSDNYMPLCRKCYQMCK